VPKGTGGSNPPPSAIDGPARNIVGYFAFFD
jgi:hypothetical protein